MEERRQFQEVDPFDPPYGRVRARSDGGLIHPVHVEGPGGWGWRNDRKLLESYKMDKIASYAC